MEGYFTYDKGIRDAMLHILWLIDQESYSSADNACDKLLKDCYITEGL